jgi:hypothetical protein
MKKCSELLSFGLPVCPVFGTPAAGSEMTMDPVRIRKRGRMVREKPDPAFAV